MYLNLLKNNKYIFFNGKNVLKNEFWNNLFLTANYPKKIKPRISEYHLESRISGKKFCKNPELPQNRKFGRTGNLKKFFFHLGPAISANELCLFRRNKHFFLL